MNKSIIGVILFLLITGMGLSMANVAISDISILETNITNEMYSAACSILIPGDSCGNYTAVKHLLDNICNISCVIGACVIDNAHLNAYSHYDKHLCKLSKNIMNVVSGNALRVSLYINTGLLVLSSISVLILVSVIAYAAIYKNSNDRNFTDTNEFQPRYDPL